MMSQYTSLPALRKRMHGQADTLHLLEAKEKGEVIGQARNHLNVTKKDFRKARKPQTPSKYQSIENSINDDPYASINVRAEFVNTHKSSGRAFAELSAKEAAAQRAKDVE